MVIYHNTCKYSLFNFYYASEDLVQTIGFSLEYLGSNQYFI